MVKINGEEMSARKVPKIIRDQPGYSGEGSYQVSRATTGGYRLYKAVGLDWMDASLKDVDGLGIHLAGEAARALGSIKTSKKAASSRANGARGGRPRKAKE